MNFGRALVTGGSGFIGTHLVEALLGNGVEVRNIDVRAPYRPDHEAWWTKGDLLDRAQVRQVVEDFRPDVIFNLAAIADLSGGGDAFRVNTEGLSNVIEAALAQPTPPRLVHTSTQFVIRPGYDAKGPRDYAPYSEYGETKAKSEEILWAADEALQWTILRPTIVWGPWHTILANSTWRYLHRRWYVVPSSKDPVRSYGYVRNVVAQLMAAADADRDTVNRQVFYTGDEPMPSSRWLDGFSRALSGRPVRRVPWFLFAGAALGGEISGRLGGPSPLNFGRLFRMTNDAPVAMEPTLQVLGPGPCSLEDGLRETVDWLRTYDPAEFNRA